MVCYNTSMRKSIYTLELLAPIIANSVTWADVCRALNLKPATGSQTYIKNLAAKYGTGTSHFVGQGWSKGKTFRKKPLTFYLVKGSTINSHNLKLRLIREGYKKHLCEGCFNTKWRSFSIPLELHHINGDKNDNRLKNLEILCPNCHALTANYSGKVKRKSYATLLKRM